MTFGVREASRRTGAPVELYRFVHGATSYFYTSADEAQTYDGDTYLPSTLVRGRLVSGEQGAVEGLEIECPRDHPLRAVFVDGRPTSPVQCTLFVRHRGDGDEDTRQVLLGHITQTRPGRTLTLIVRTLAGRLNRSIPLAVLSRTCQHMLYGPGCGLDPADFRHAGTVTAVAGKTVTVSGVADYLAANPPRTFAGGTLLTAAGAVAGFIEAHDDDDLILMAAPDLAVDDAVLVQVGCPRTVEYCRDAMANADRHLAFPTIPTRNPYAPDGRGLKIR